MWYVRSSVFTFIVKDANIFRYPRPWNTNMAAMAFVELVPGK